MKKQGRKSVGPGSTERAADTHLQLDLIMAARLARQLGISAVTLWRWRNTKGFPPGRRIRNHVYFSQAAVLAWIDRQQQAAERHPEINLQRTRAFGGDCP